MVKKKKYLVLFALKIMPEAMNFAMNILEEAALQNIFPT